MAPSLGNAPLFSCSPRYVRDFEDRFVTEQFHERVGRGDAAGRGHRFVKVHAGRNGAPQLAAGHRHGPRDDIEAVFANVQEEGKDLALVPHELGRVILGARTHDGSVVAHDARRGDGVENVFFSARRRHFDEGAKRSDEAVRLGRRPPHSGGQWGWGWKKGVSGEG